MIGMQLSRWLPTHDVTGHAGQPIPSNMAFFEAPPKEIGEVITAHSTMTDKGPRSTSTRVAYVLVAGLAGAAIGAGGTALAGLYDMSVVMACILGIFGMCIVAYSTRDVPTCTYVGKGGLARIPFSTSNPEVHKGYVLLFEDAVRLNTSQTRQYINGIYCGTSYSHAWRDKNAAVTYQISGGYRSSKGTPPTSNTYYFACAAESAWSAYCLENALKCWEENEFVRFGLSGGDYIELGPRSISLTIGGKTASCDAQDIADLSIYDGQITLKQKGAKSGFFGLGSSGVYKFAYEYLDNAQLFLLLFGHMVSTNESVVQ